jgi:hypothetical protein
MFEGFDQLRLNQEKRENLRKLLEDPLKYISTPLIYPFTDKDKDYATP